MSVAPITAAPGVDDDAPRSGLAPALASIMAGIKPPPGYRAAPEPTHAPTSNEALADRQRDQGHA